MIVGAGPDGLTLEAGLTKQRIRSIVLEKKTELAEHSRALAVQAQYFKISGLLRHGGRVHAGGLLPSSN